MSMSFEVIREHLRLLEAFGITECFPLPHYQIPYPEFERVFKGREVEVTTHGNSRHFRGEIAPGLFAVSVALHPSSANPSRVTL